MPQRLQVKGLSYPQGLCTVWRNYKRVIRSNAAVVKQPPTRPPRWARQSTPPRMKPNTKLSPTITQISRTPSLMRLRSAMKAPNKPKIAPDAPTETWRSFVRQIEASEPVKSETKKITRKRALPSAASMGFPKTRSENILKNRCVSPPWTRATVKSRQYSPESTNGRKRAV